MPDKKKIGLFGGTFDPPHHAHLTLALWVLNRLSLHYVYFIPTAIHAFKNRKMLTPQDTRYQMLESVIVGHPELKISKIEFNRPAISYTVDTLREFCRYEKIDQAKLFYIIGMDNLLEFPLWKDPDKILNLAQVVVMKRPGYKIKHTIKQYLNQVILIETPTINISSTQIRKLVAAGKAFEHLVPSGVADIIEKHRLYQSG